LLEEEENEREKRNLEKICCLVEREDVRMEDVVTEVFHALEDKGSWGSRSSGCLEEVMPP
jgi:hypothetical protein